MSYEPADHPVEFGRSAAGELIGLGAQLSPANIQGLRKLISVLIIASAVSACTFRPARSLPGGRGLFAAPAMNRRVLAVLKLFLAR